MVSTHSKIGPSSATRWTDCTASVLLTQMMGDGKRAKTTEAKAYALAQIQRVFPDETAESFSPACEAWVANRESKFAKEGTDAHDWAEKVLKKKITIDDVPPEFAPVREYIKLCQTLENRWEGQVFVESKVPLFYHRPDHGTVDHAIISKEGRVLITDLKYGAGIPVEAKDNLQLSIYALSFIEEYDIIHDFSDTTPVEIRIFQPRTDDGERLWETTVGELRAMTQHIPSVAAAILDTLVGKLPPGTLKFSPTHSNCRFCPNKYVCGARGLNATAPLAVSEQLEEVVQFAGRLVSPADIAKIFSRKKEIMAILADAEEILTRMAAEGNPVPGTKLVKGRDGNRAWADPEKAAEILEMSFQREVLFDTVLKSPTKIFKYLKDIASSKQEMEFYEKLVMRPDGRPVLTTSDDPRPALSSVEHLFDEIPDQEEP